MSVNRDIYRAVHERKWLSVEYLNGQGRTTRYWVGVKDIDPRQRTLRVRGMHLGSYTVKDLTIRVDGIESSSLIDESYFPTPSELIERIDRDEDRFSSIFGTVPNLNVLNYLADCSRLNVAPATKEFSLIKRVDEDSFARGALCLDREQFAAVVKRAQDRARYPHKGLRAKFEQLALNVLSVRGAGGLYVIAYRQLRLDPERRTLVIGHNTILCREFVVRNGKAFERQSIRRYLGEEDLHLLSSFDENRERIKDLMAKRISAPRLVDDVPYLLIITRDATVDLQREYDGIYAMYERGEPTVPIKAFFGDLTKRPVRRREFPLILLDQHINMDQLTATHQALKYPVTYVQGPPGTGKTTTIVNILVNALYNERTVLFASFNNHPVDGVFKSLGSYSWNGKALPLPVIRLGNNAVMIQALERMRTLYELVKDESVTPDRMMELSRIDGKLRAKDLSDLLKEYEENLDLQERKECIEKLAKDADDFFFKLELQSVQLELVRKRLKRVEPAEKTLERALKLMDRDQESLLRQLFCLSVRRIKRLGEPRVDELREIVFSTQADDERVTAFNHYLSDTDNLKKFLRIFPIVATTCISAHKLGQPVPSFDMVVIDEASQCDSACALVPIVRGQNLTLVGDPAQLSPVVVIDGTDNATLRRTYNIPDEYDFIENSAYKTFLACDSVSNEILLHEHYRCDEKIIGFNNRKYYNGKLSVKSGRNSPGALSYYNVEGDVSREKNVAPAEAAAIVDYVRKNCDKQIGIITPFARQREYLLSSLSAQGFDDVPCGTVHAFQGDEKDVILFSLALTDRTTPATYAWVANNQELINVATSRARDELVIFSSDRELDRLHGSMKGPDDLCELVRYVKQNGKSLVTPRSVSSRALGIKPYSTKTEAAFFESLNHALSNVFTSQVRHVVHHEVPIAQVFDENVAQQQLFYSGRFDFVVYEVEPDGTEVPVLAIELDGKEHRANEAVMRRDEQKNEICRRHKLQLIRVENSYARRYAFIKSILEKFFSIRR